MKVYPLDGTSPETQGIQISHSTQELAWSKLLAINSSYVQKIEFISCQEVDFLGQPIPYIVDPKTILATLRDIYRTLTMNLEFVQENKYNKLNPEAMEIAKELVDIKKLIDKLWEVL